MVDYRLLWEISTGVKFTQARWRRRLLLCFSQAPLATSAHSQRTTLLVGAHLRSFASLPGQTRGWQTMARGAKPALVSYGPQTKNGFYMF